MTDTLISALSAVTTVATTDNLLVNHDAGAGSFQTRRITLANFQNSIALPISTGVSGLGTGVATFLATPSSANLLSALTTKTGTGNNVFDTSPSIATPTITGTMTTATILTSNNTGLQMKTSGGTAKAAFKLDATDEWHFGDTAFNAGFHWDNSGGGADAMQVTSQGSWLLATTTTSLTKGLAAFPASGNEWLLKIGGTLTTANARMSFVNGNGEVGTIITSGSATAYNTSSDERLKTNITDASEAGAIIDALKVRSWTWKVDGSYEAFGFIAQEEALVYAPAVTAGDTDPDVITRQWGRDDSKLVPLLVKEIQALRARIAALEALTV